MKTKFSYADTVAAFIGHGLTMPATSKSTVEQIAGRIRHREYRARRDKKRRMKEAALTPTPETKTL